MLRKKLIYVFYEDELYFRLTNIAWNHDPVNEASGDDGPSSMVLDGPYSVTQQYCIWDLQKMEFRGVDCRMSSVM